MTDRELLALLSSANVQGELYPLCRRFGVKGYAGKVTKAENCARLLERILAAGQDTVDSVGAELLAHAVTDTADGHQSDAERKLQALRDLFGEGGCDKDAVRQVVEEMLAIERENTRERIADAVKAQHDAMSCVRIVVERPQVATVDVGVQHKAFPQLVRMANARHVDGKRLNIYLWGPPGTGKTTAGRMLAKALGMQFEFTGAVESRYDMSGFVDAQGRCLRTVLRKIWEEGGVFLFDEMDSSDPRAVTWFNSMTGNGIASWPDGTSSERHDDCVLVCGCNTLGRGATADHSARVKLDGATIDRWCYLRWAIDERLEMHIAGNGNDEPTRERNREWCAFVQKLRAAVRHLKLQQAITVTPRATYFGVTLLEAGMTRDEVLESVVWKGAPEETIRSVLAEVGAQ